MSVEDVIRNWSDEEKESLKDLIEECLERESIIEDARRRSLKGLREIELT